MTYFNDSKLNLLRQTEADLSAMEARIKATRMQVRVLADDRERSLRIAADIVMSSVCDEPSADDQLEFDEMRFDGLSPSEAFMDRVASVEFDITEGEYL